MATATTVEEVVDSDTQLPKIEDRRLFIPFLFTTLPAVPILLGSVYLLSRPDALNFIVHPLGLLSLAGALVLAALPVRLAMYTFSLRESSPQSRKLWAAVQCAVPALGVFLVFPTALKSGFTTSRIILIVFFGSYLAAFAALLLDLVRSAAKKKTTQQLLRPLLPPPYET